MLEKLLMRITHIVSVVKGERNMRYHYTPREGGNPWSGMSAKAEGFGPWTPDQAGGDKEGVMELAWLASKKLLDRP